ncbi:MAG: hypothetical protein LPL29_02185 [Alphaproteobacteria bacterium]|nr:hypothetical protein [Alphaproteobacteria bacterium]
MTQVLNLDSLKVTKEVVFGGKTRQVRSLTVKQFIESRDFDEKMKTADSAGQVDLLVEFAMKHIDAEKDELLQLDLAQLTALLSFIRGTDAADEAGVTEGNGEKKAS